MHKETLLLIVGVLVFITPFLGLPHQWFSIMLFVLGGLTVLIALSCRMATRRRRRRREVQQTYVEYRPGSEEEETVIVRE